MQYDQLIEDIFRRHPSVQNTGFTGASYKAGIESMQEFDAALGSPWKSCPCIHVAGTNGKGSVSSMLAVGWAAAQGGPVGLFTSPHLLDFRERIKIISSEGGLHYEMIPRKDVMLFLETYEKQIEHLSFFEITTGMAFWWFRKVGAKGAVIEVGLGGRLDSTNIITPVLSVITSIGLDHCAMLGSTRALIAGEKAGIIKPGIPAVIWAEDEETAPVFRARADETGSPLYAADKVCPALPEIELDLKGEYQDINLRTALASLKVLNIKADLNAISHTARISGLRGRWETLSGRPLTICDIGHNPAALRYNFRQLASYGKKMFIVYGIMRDKALEDIAPLMPSGAEYFLCAPAGERAMPVEELYRRLHAVRPDLALTPCPADGAEGSVKSAWKKAKAQAGPEDLIYIGGSNFVVAEALEEL